MKLPDGVHCLDRDRHILKAFKLYQLEHLWQEKIHVSHKTVLAVNVEKLDQFEHLHRLGKHDFIDSFKDDVRELVYVFWYIDNDGIDTLVEVKDQISIIRLDKDHKWRNDDGQEFNAVGDQVFYYVAHAL